MYEIVLMIYKSRPTESTLIKLERSKLKSSLIIFLKICYIITVVSKTALCSLNLFQSFLLSCLMESFKMLNTVVIT